MHKYVTYFFGVLFLVFAYIQLNDVDPAKWVIFYSLTGLLPIAAMHWRKMKYGVYALTAIAAVISLFYLPDFFGWVKDGFPTITGSMKAESPYVELVREFLGVFICLVYLGSVLFFGRRRVSS